MPFPDQHLIIIALGDLNLENGLVTNVGLENLVSGHDLIIDGSDEMWFSGRGGGMALFLVLNLI